MDKTQIVELLKCSSPYSILIVNKTGRLLELHCPFIVLAKYSFLLIKEGQKLEVSRVLLTENLTIVYQIDNKKFHFYHFEILV